MQRVPSPRWRGEGQGEGDLGPEMRGADPSRTNRARSLRRGMTRAEWALWQRLRDRRLGGLKFIRQQPLGPYYGDFVCRERRLIVELDGGQHAERVADNKRDATLAATGYRLIRYWNNDVLQNIEGVLEALRHELGIAPHPVSLPAPHPVPLPAGGERERSRGDRASAEPDAQLRHHRS